MVKIKIKSSNLGKLERFYIETLGFTETDDGLMFPSSGGVPGAVINILHDRAKNPPKGQSSRSSIYFSYSIERNFLSYCQKLINDNVQFEVIGATPGGYAARAVDPEGNTFEFECDSFEEDDDSINPRDWPAYTRF